MDYSGDRILEPSVAHLLLESMADGVFTLDERGKITLWNPALELITGYTAQEALGKGCEVLNFNL